MIYLRKQIGKSMADADQTVDTGLSVDTSEYDGTRDFYESIAEGFRVIRERIANGGPGWTPKSTED